MKILKTDFRNHNDEEWLKKKELGTIDESIRAALPYTLVGPDIWELCK